MAVKPVEYNHQSSSADLQAATQGASKSDLKDVTLTASNANEVKKDEDQGFTEALDGAQKAFLDDNVDTDTITYTEDEKKNTGKKVIDTKNTDKKTSAANVAATSTGAVAGAAASAGGLLFATTYITQINAAKKGAEFPFACLVAAAIALAGSILSSASVKAFDNEYKNRMDQNSKAADTNATIQQYNDTLNSNVEAMGQESSKYTELSGKTQDTNLNNVQQLAALQIQYNDLIAQGNIKGAADIKAQIDALKQGAAEDPNADAMKECKDNIANYQQNSAEASGVVESGSTVAGFLQNGKPMAVIGTVNATILALCALVAVLGAAASIKSVMKAPLFTKIPAAIAGIAAAVMFVASGAILGMAAKDMNSKAKDENSCANSGDAMESKVNDLNAQIVTQSGETDTVSTGYTTEDTTVAEVTQKAQEAANKGVASSKTTTEENNKPIKKPDTGAGVGAGAGAGAGVAA